MKNTLKIISFLSLLILGSTSIFIYAKRPIDDKPETIIIESNNSGIRANILVYSGNNAVEKTSTRGDEAVNAVLDIIQKYNSKGYKVISSSSTQSNMIRDTYLLSLK